MILNRMKARSVLFGSLMAAWSTVSLAATWTIDESHSQALFTVKHLMVSNVTGKMTGLKGAVDIDDADVTKSKVDVTIDVNTINTDNNKRDDHLKSPDFFDTKKFPSMKFVSTKVEKAGEGLKVTGDLTMHGVTKSVVLDVEGPTAAIKDPWGNEKRGVSATTKLSRKDFGLNWNKALEAGGVMVGDDVKVAIELELNAKKADDGKAAEAKKVEKKKKK